MSSKSKHLRDELPSAAGGCPAAFQVGQFLGKKALSVGINSVCFDRGDYKYHGRVKALAEGARKSGLAF
jgi:large subunit ribosomal protein L18